MKRLREALCTCQQQVTWASGYLDADVDPDCPVCPTPVSAVPDTEPHDTRCPSKIAHEEGAVVRCMLFAGHQEAIKAPHWAELSGEWSDGDERIICTCRQQLPCPHHGLREQLLMGEAAASAGMALDGEARAPEVQAGCHAWTRHGHHCCRDAPLSLATRPSGIARCGGPGLCSKCAAEAGQIHATAADGSGR